MAKRKKKWTIDYAGDYGDTLISPKNEVAFAFDHTDSHLTDEQGDRLIHRIARLLNEDDARKASKKKAKVKK
jgi:hypothetical protein